MIPLDDRIFAMAYLALLLSFIAIRRLHLLGLRYGQTHGATGGYKEYLALLKERKNFDPEAALALRSLTSANRMFMLLWTCTSLVLGAHYATGWWD